MSITVLLCEVGVVYDYSVLDQIISICKLLNHLLHDWFLNKSLLPLQTIVEWMKIVRFTTTSFSHLLC